MLTAAKAMATATATFDCVVVVLGWLAGWLTGLRWAVRGMMEGKCRRGRRITEAKKRPWRETETTTYPWFDDARFEALSASCCPSVVIMGFSSFFRFLGAPPLETLDTCCFAFWIAACASVLLPFIVGSVWAEGLVFCDTLRG